MIFSMIPTEEEHLFFTELYCTYRSQVYSIAVSYLDEPSDAEDIVHDIFYLIADRFSETLRRKTEKDRRRFLFTCARNRSLKLLERRSKTVSLDELLESGRIITDGSEYTIDEIAEDNEMIAKAAKAICGLDPVYADVLWMELQGFSAEEIAGLFNERKATVRKRLYRAKRMLRDAVLGEGGSK